MNLVFAGTPEFAQAFLEELLHVPNVEISGVYTQPDRPAGRGKQLRPSPVKQLAVANNLPVFQPQSLKDVDVQKQLAELKPDLMVVVAYGQILPEAILNIPRYGCINVHASLLPRWRGAAPIHRAIAAGDSETGISIMRMDVGLDTGDVLAENQLNIRADDTTGSLHDRLIELGRPLLRQVIAAFPEILDRAVPQDDTNATYAKKILTAESAVDWSKSAKELDALIRALNPAPGAYTFVENERVKIWAAAVSEGKGKPGEILRVAENGIEVACGQGSLILQKIQLAGKPVVDISDLLRGHASKFAPGLYFNSGASS